jgi:outer membrane protein assembly factor BamE (lipoprotein component of BamABCDE complex)
MRPFLAVLAMALLAGCGDPHFPQPVLTHTAQPVCADSGPKAASLYRGMPPQDVVAVLGEPARKEPFRYGELPAETWYYSADPLNDYVELTNGKLASWRLQRCVALTE